MQPFPPPAPGAGAPGGAGPQPPPRRRGPVVVGTAVLVALLLGVGATTWAIVAGIDTAPSSSTATVEPGPDGWDPRLSELAAFVADVRGRPFLRPVPVEFLDDADFEAAVVGEEEPTEDDLAELAVATAQMRALGLIGPGVDLAAEIDQLVGGGTLAFYDSEDERITVRGREIGVAARATLVHELTHAWQDQHFDLDRIEDLDLIEGANLRTLAEGDATRVEDVYLGELSARELREYERESSEASSTATQQLADVPDLLLASFMAPYAIGPSFVAVLEIEGGNDAVDEALRDPPDTELELLDPALWLRGFRATEVVAPQAPAGAEAVEEEEFGALSWLFTLGARLDPREALDLLDGWAGDRSTTYRHEGRGCVAVTVAAIDAEALARWEAALGSWVAAGPAGAAAVERSADELLLRACESPDVPAPAPGAIGVALDYAAVRLVIFEDVYAEPSTTPDQAGCFARSVTARITPDEMASGQPLSAMESQRRGAAAARECLD